MSYSKLIKKSGEVSFFTKSRKAKDDANPDPPLKLSPHMLDEVKFERIGTMAPEEIERQYNNWLALQKTV
jgi:hypothetical protein